VTDQIVHDVEVPALLDGVRVDRAVAMVADVSRSAAADLIDTGRVSVGGRPVTSRHLVLSAGQSLRIAVPADDAGGLDADATVDFDVVFEDRHVIVVDKPAGLVVHPGAGRTHGTLASGLVARFPDLALTTGIGDPGRPGIVHRLDRGTSGLLVVARTEQAYGSLVSQLSHHTVRRRYVTLVAGHVADDRGIVDAPIGRSARIPTKMAVTSQGREARTRYRVVRRYPDLPGTHAADADPRPASLLVVDLETGRTHQIRVHLAAIGHPVVGDERYGRPSGGLLAPGRVFLHAAELAFVHPSTGTPVRFQSVLPPDLAGIVGELPDLDGESDLRPPGGSR
jgi:23S rRNA pseudouridine1911/1915/1917 synthase